MKKNDEIRISDILYEIVKHRVLIISLTIAGLLVGIVLSGVSFLRGEMSKQYIITSSFTVNTQTEQGLFTSGQEFPNQSDITMSEDLVNTVSYVFKSDKMLEDIINSLGLLGVTTKDIYDNLSLQPYEETQIIEMSLYWRSADEGINILTELNQKAPEILKETLNIGSISVLNQPAARYIIGGNINVAFWGYMALIGLGLGLAIAISKLFIHPTLINLKDIKQVFKKELLGDIIEDKAYFDRRKSILEDDGISPNIKESFASVANIIQSRLSKRDGSHIIYVTSTMRGEGRTSVTANLAVQLSELENRVLLIDLDTKNPSLSGLFLKNIDYAHSLNAFCSGDISKAEAVVSLNGYLDIMPTILERSPIPIDSNLFHVIQQIAVDYDYVLIDTAPVGLTADPMNLNQIASAGLFVIRFDDVTLKEIKSAVERIEKIEVNLLGCIVNGVKISKKEIQDPVKIRNAEAKRDMMGDPLVKLETPKSMENFDTGMKDTGAPLVTDFSEDIAVDETEKQPETVASSRDFIDLLFQAESNQTSDEEKN